MLLALLFLLKLPERKMGVAVETVGWPAVEPLNRVKEELLDRAEEELALAALLPAAPAPAVITAGMKGKEEEEEEGRAALSLPA